MRAYAASDGRVLWEFNTARPFTTVNGVTAKGGSPNGPGPIVAGGMMFMNSGSHVSGIRIVGRQRAAGIQLRTK
jgi:hypothetical protein